MAQLRQDYAQFKARETEVLVIGADNTQKFKEYFAEHNLPYPGLPDPNHRVLKLYGQEVKLFKFGRMPAQVLVDKAGMARFIHYGNDMTDIPPTEEMLGLIDSL